MQYDLTTRRPSTQDITGHTFGRWTVLCFAGYVRTRVQYWTCQCLCGTVKDIIRGNLGRVSRSCGCLIRETTILRNLTHGMSFLPEYSVWLGMRQRCNRPHDHKYSTYGGRGITICEAWNDFAIFYRDMGPRPSPQHSIERLNNDEGYNPANCIWATPPVQSRNTRQNVFITHNGQTMCVTDWAHTVGLPPKIFRQRLDRGWSIDEALTIPQKRLGRPNRRPQSQGA